MFDLTILFKRAGKAAAENSPAILTALGVSGTLTTAYLAAKAGFKSADVLREAEKAKEQKYLEGHQDVDPIDLDKDLNDSTPVEDLTFQEKGEAVWKLYLPAATSAALTVTAIILAARVSERRNAALAAAYTTVERSFSEYRAKTLEKSGKRKEQEIRDEIAQDGVNANPPSRNAIIITKTGGETLVKDAWSGRYFTSGRNLVDRAVNEFNSQLIKDGYGSLTDFWHLLEIPSTTDSDYIGWSADQIMEIDWSGVIDDKDEPALCFTFRNPPNPRFASAF